MGFIKTRLLPGTQYWGYWSWLFPQSADFHMNMLCEDGMGFGFCLLSVNASFSNCFLPVSIVHRAMIINQ